MLAVQYDIPMSHVRTLGIVRSMKSVEDQDVLQDEFLKRIYCPISHFHVSARLRIELQAVCRREFSMWQHLMNWLRSNMLITVRGILSLFSL